MGKKNKKAKRNYYRNRNGSSTGPEITKPQSNESAVNDVLVQNVVTKMPDTCNKGDVSDLCTSSDQKIDSADKNEAPTANKTHKIPKKHNDSINNDMWIESILEKENASNETNDTIVNDNLVDMKNPQDVSHLQCNKIEQENISVEFMETKNQISDKQEMICRSASECVVQELEDFSNTNDSSFQIENGSLKENFHEIKPEENDEKCVISENTESPNLERIESLKTNEHLNDANNSFEQSLDNVVDKLGSLKIEQHGENLDKEFSENPFKKKLDDISENTTESSSKEIFDGTSQSPGPLNVESTTSEEELSLFEQNGKIGEPKQNNKSLLDDDLSIDMKKETKFDIEIGSNSKSIDPTNMKAVTNTGTILDDNFKEIAIASREIDDQSQENGDLMNKDVSSTLEPSTNIPTNTDKTKTTDGDVAEEANKDVTKKKHTFCVKWFKNLFTRK